MTMMMRIMAIMVMSKSMTTLVKVTMAMDTGRGGHIWSSCGWALFDICSGLHSSDDHPQIWPPVLYRGLWLSYCGGRLPCGWMPLHDWGAGLQGGLRQQVRVCDGGAHHLMPVRKITRYMYTKDPQDICTNIWTSNVNRIVFMNPLPEEVHEQAR